ncbi:uncharacterized protein LOC128552484 [Mercenaria mercenaria]|uniref:uncharacterized protein LOC128552484 n=1 Tax=Mercenaria mercenaria TaxID=6596 RepID=UPI00234E4612|nr:uncharacterized protein LOC128552484 [Mercenaria mercenaria]XP_053389508.1 uncharacterized protein LOC128552484 [Mercenaria mercenaria]
MLKEARKYDLYESYYIEFLSKNPTTIPADTYDALVGSGIYGEAAHVPSEALFEMIRLVKPGGYIVLTTRHHLVTDGIAYTDLEPLMDKLETDGRWRKISRDIYSGCYYDLDGIIWCYQVL